MAEAGARRAAFLDRDGVINLDHAYVHRRADFTFVDGVLEAARTLKQLDFALVVVTNQSGIGRGLYTEADFHTLTAWMRDRFAAAGAALDAVLFCPHHPTAAQGAYRRDCACRKPAPGMLFEAARALDLALDRSVLFGDKASDLEAARAAGVPLRYLLGTDGRAVPPAPAHAGLASGCFRTLGDAVGSTAFRTAIAAPVGG